MRSRRSPLCALALVFGALVHTSPASAQSDAPTSPSPLPSGPYVAPLTQPYAPPPPLAYRPFSLVDDEGNPRQVWYGWQSLIIHGVSTSLLAVSPVGDGAGAPFSVPLAVTGMIFAAPIVHWAHGHVGRGFASLGLQLGAGLAGGLTGGAIAAGVTGGNDSGIAFLVGMLVGAPVGATGGFIIDVAVLAYEPLTEKGAADMAKASQIPQLVPLIDVRKDRAVFGLAGAF